MEIIKSYRDILEILYKFFPRMSKAQLKKITEIEDDYLLTIYLISAYNVFEVTRHMERSYMITNPEKLDVTIFDTKLFLKECKEFAFVALDTIEREEKQKKMKEEKQDE